MAHNEVAGSQREQSRLIFKMALSVVTSNWQGFNFDVDMLSQIT